MKTLFRLLFAFFMIYAHVSAADLSPSWYSKNADNKVVINVEMFLSSTCSHCQKADAFFSELEQNSPYLHIQRNFINQDKDALIRYSQLLNAQQIDDFAVPSIYFCDSRWVGFDSASTTGKDLLAAIQYCKHQIESKGSLTKTTVNTLRHWANANRFNSGMIEKPSALRYTLTIALMDSFNPCAYFCFAGFLAFLLIAEKRKNKIIASLFFIASVALVHYFQQVYTSDYFAFLPWLRLPAALLGLGTIYFVIQHYKKQSNDVLYCSLAFFSGLITTIYQQTCVMNWSTIFEQWINNQHFSNWQINLYQLIYQGMYILPLIAILFIYLALLKLKRFAVLKTRLASMGLLFLIVIALCFIIYPFMLSHFTFSLLILFILAVCSFLINLT
ncbi:Uncharacterised protein [Legionella sainthelensi]|uniref:hypothetical protein n=1 Tax=Legionella sainthelensi TaxID=28087 RepID=UPI000F6D2CDE|nr:hypothetical protein [Legionella sainthelensi]VEB36643.1 Uncharacterised protein [Legionella sainthelensi]